MQTATKLFPAWERALSVFQQILNGVRQDQLEAPTPCTEWDVRAVIGHIIGLNELVGMGEIRQPVGGPPPGIEELRTSFVNAMEAARQALSAEGALGRTFTMPWAEMTGEQLLTIGFLDLVIHAWDLATATGQKALLDPDLCALALEIGRPMMEGMPRDPSTGFGPEVPISDEAPVCDRLAAFYGRQP